MIVKMYRTLDRRLFFGAKVDGDGNVLGTITFIFSALDNTVKLGISLNPVWVSDCSCRCGDLCCGHMG